MSIPGNAEPMAFSGQQQAQQHQSINFSHAIPIKKRRFPIIRPSSPPPEEKPSRSEGQGSNKKQESKISDESGERKIASPGNSDVSKISTSIVKKEVTAGILASKSHEAKTSGSLGPKDELKNNMNILRDVKPSVPEVPKRSIAAQNMNVKPEVISGQTEDTCTLEVSRGSMNIELSLGPKESVSPALVRLSSAAIPHRSDKSDPPLLSFALREENRSNWDLNTTMDVWGEGSNNTDPLVDIGGLKKNNSCQDEKSSLTTAGSVGLNLNKGKHVLDNQKSDCSNVSKQPIQQSTIDDSLGLRLAMPYRESNLQQAQISAKNVNRTVKREPVDENSKLVCSIGSSSSSNMGLSKFSSVKREFVNNQETILQKSIKSELVQEGTKQAGMFEEAIGARQPVAKVMQHQESCVSSSALPVPLLSQNSSRMSVCSELTTSKNLPNLPEHSFHSKELYDPNDIPDEQIASMVSESGETELRPSKVGSSSCVVSDNKCKLPRVDEHTTELCQSSELAANVGEKMNLSVEMEDAFGSDCETQGNRGVDSSMHVEENVCPKEDEEYEDGEVREPLQDSAGEDRIVEGKKTENLKLVESSDSVMLGDQNIASDLNREEDAVKENHDDSNKDCVGASYEILSEDNSLRKLSEEVLEVGVDNKSSINVSPAKKLDPEAAKDVNGSILKEVSTDLVATKDGVELGDESTDNVVKEICLGESDSTSYKVEAPLNDHDVSKDPYNASNKSRIINLSRATAVTSPCKTRTVPNRLLTSRSGKERYSDPDGEMQPRGNRDEIYNGGSNKFVKDRNSRPTFMVGKGRISGRFGSMRGEWDSDHNFASESNSYGPSDYRVVRRKYASPIPDVELECNGYGIPQDGTSLGSNRRKGVNDEFPNLRRNSFRRLSPGPWSSPRRRSPNGLQELNQYRSPAMYRMGRERSPDRSCFRDEMVSRRRGSPSYVSRHVPNDIRDSDTVHPRSGNSNRRGGGSPGRLFPRSGRRRDGFDSREMGDGDEYINGPLHSNKFHAEGNIDERRNFLGRGGPPIRSFRPNYANEGENFRFHMNDGPRPYRFCPDGDAEFVERSNMREREFDGRIKHQSFGSRRIRNIEEQQDGNYRPVQRVWHDNDGFNDARVKRKRF